MIEMMASIAILALGIIVIYGIFSNFIVLTNTISSRLTAIYLAKEGMEIVRNIRDNNLVNDDNWDKNLKNCGNGCQADYKTETSVESNENKIKNYNDNNYLNENADGFYSYDVGIPSKFKRKITIDDSLNSVLKITVQVFWNYNEKQLSFELIDYLYE